MLDPDHRSLYTSALTPPDGYVFDAAVATTFSLDPASLLTIPVHIAALGMERSEQLEGDGLSLLESLRRTARRTTVFAQRGRMLVPSRSSLMYSLLESMVVEVKPPRPGVFHPKIWLLRFVDPHEDGSVLLRLMILSRNLTADRSWDVALRLEGRPGKRYVGPNRDLGLLLRDLPKWAFEEVSAERAATLGQLADELRKTRWELPEGFDSVRFHVLGRSRERKWMPTSRTGLVVISPFCSDEALSVLTDLSSKPAALVSRPETLADLSDSTRARFPKCLTLHEAAETEDGEGSEVRDTLGLHAKVLITRVGKDNHVYVGSANATSAALMRGHNIEVMAELVGRWTALRAIERVVGSESKLGDLLVDFDPPEEAPAEDKAAREAQKALEVARSRLAGMALSIVCEQLDDDTWDLRLRAPSTFRLDGIGRATAWPISLDQEHQVDIMPLRYGKDVSMRRLSTVSVTGLVAFELRARETGATLRFSLNLPVRGLPADREACVVRTVMRNRDGFLRYLMLLFGDVAAFGGPPPDGNGSGSGGGWGAGDGSGMPLIEGLTRAFCRDPDRLRDADATIRKLIEGDFEEEIVPARFRVMWEVFRDALGMGDR